MHRRIATRRLLSGLTCALLAALLTQSCAVRSPDSSNVIVAASVSPITNLVENIAGERAQIVGLVPEGVNSHSFEPSPSSIKAIAEADLVFINGLNLEEPIKRLAEANIKEGGKLIELGSRTITRQEWIFDFSFPAERGDPNPHLWTNPPFAKRFAEVVAQELAGVDPQHADEYARNYETLAAKIDALDEASRSATASVPVERRKLLTYHDSFPYFAREYKWEVIGAIQPSDFSEPTPQEVAGLIRQIKSEKVPAIFGSEVFPSGVLEQIAKESGAKYVSDLRDDDLPGEPGDPEHSYLGLMRFNLVTMIQAFGGDASALAALDVANLS